ncbi:MAG: hypothetical protein V5A37_00450 [Halobacteriales archaeon]
MDGNGLRDSLPTFEDDLELWGVLAGGFLVLVGLGTLVGMPWRYNTGILVSIAQLIGILATIAVGAGLVWLARTDGDGLPFR